MVSQKEEKKSDMITDLREGNISLILDSYDDIFSDFDPRSYREKALSDDFLIECKKAARDKEDNKLELRFLVPKQKRNYKEEFQIKKRLKEHFHRHYIEKQKDIRKINIGGIIWFVLGALLMIIGTLLYPLTEKGFIYRLSFIISEPASWFFFWEGLGKIFISSKKERPDYNFYKKMSRIEIVFLDY